MILKLSLTYKVLSLRRLRDSKFLCSVHLSHLKCNHVINNELRILILDICAFSTVSFSKVVFRATTCSVIMFIYLQPCFIIFAHKNLITNIIRFYPSN